MRNLQKWLLLFFFLPFLHTQAQLTIQDGTSLTILPDTRFSLNQNIHIENGGTLNNKGIFSFKGNLSNDGFLWHSNTSRFVANGTDKQNIYGSQSVLLSHFTLNNPAGISLSAPVSITDSLILLDGILYSSASNPIRFSTTAANPVESTTSHIIGQAIMEERNLGIEALPPFLGAGRTAGSDVGTVEIIRATGEEGITSIDGRKSIAANWSIHSTTPDVNGRNLSLSWLSAIDNHNFTRAVHLYAKGATYEKISNQSADVSGTDPRLYTYNSIDRLNRNFTILDTGFRMKFLQFTGNRQQEGVQLKWLTGTEFNNKGFDIERSSDGVHFTKIDFEGGKNDLTSNAYAYLDRSVNALKGNLIYYRLKQISNDGSEQYSDTIVLVLYGIVYFNVYPNPFTEVLKIDVVKNDDDALQLRLVSANGSVVYKNAYSVGRTGHIELKGLHNLAAGVYFLNITNKHFYETIKVIKYH